MGLVVVKGSLRSGSDWYKFDYWMELTPHLRTLFLWFLQTTFSLPSQNEHFNRSKTNFWQFPDWYNHHRRSNWTVIYELWNVSITNLDDSGSENALQYKHSCDIKKYISILAYYDTMKRLFCSRCFGNSTLEYIQTTTAIPRIGCPSATPPRIGCRIVSTCTAITRIDCQSLPNILQMVS